MGSDERENEKPIHEVIVLAFQIGKYPVTQAQYQAVMGNNPSRFSDSNNATHPVGEKRPNPWGIYDMHGNVWEWCADQWHPSYVNKPDNIQENGSIAWLDSRITNKSSIMRRGGSWCRDPLVCSSAYRGRSVAEICNHDIGFRVVCDLPQSVNS